MACLGLDLSILHGLFEFALIDLAWPIDLACPILVRFDRSGMPCVGLI
jgi:hypothetical protein